MAIRTLEDQLTKINECGSSENWLGVNERSFGYAPFGHDRHYAQAGFIYLDELKV